MQQSKLNSDIVMKSYDMFIGSEWTHVIVC